MAYADFIPHLIELRKRLICCLMVFAALFIIFFNLSGAVFAILAKPLLEFMPANNHMVALNVTSPFLTPLRAAFYATILISLPIHLFNLWAFILPALYARERRLIQWVLVLSQILFYLGLLFAYFFALPVAFKFFVHALPDGVELMTDISAYLDFVINIFVAFGLAFQCPLITFLFVYSGVINAENIKNIRPYVIIAVFALGMILTPPDVFSQTLLALPMWSLFELTVFIALKFASMPTHQVIDK